MPIDSSVISRLIPAQMQQTDPLERYGKSLALKNILGQGDLQAIQLRQAQQGVDDEEAVRGAYRDSGGDNARLRALLQGAGQHKQIQALDKFDLERRERESTIGKNNAAAGKSTFDMDMERLSRGAALLNEARDPASFANVLRVGQITGTFAPEAVAKMAEVGYSPENVRAFQAAGIKRVQQLEDERARATQVETGRHNLATEGNTVRGQNLTAQVAREGHGVTRAGQVMTDARARDLAQATRDAAVTGRIPPGYRKTDNGDLEVIPGGPADQKDEKITGERRRAVDMYVAARDGLLSGLEGTDTGPISGLTRPFTSGQQTAEGAVAAMAPVLKQIFRVAGEGTFTDKDQELLLNMVPKRTDNASARAAKMENIDRIVSAKLGAPVPERALKNTDKPEGQWAVVR